MDDPVSDAELMQWFEKLAVWDASAGGPEVSDTIHYGVHPDQIIDVWRPDKSRGATVVAIHGGYFLEDFDRNIHIALVRELVRRGLTVWNVEYRRIGRDGGLHETTGDIWSALDTVVAHSGTANIAVLGHSAGGYLAEWVSSHPAVGLCVAMAPVIDLALTITSGFDEGAVVQWIGAAPDQTPNLYAQSDLIARLPANARHVLLHGRRDRVVDFSQSQRFERLAKIAGEEVKLIDLPDSGHFAFIDPREKEFELVHSEFSAWYASPS